MAHNEYVRRNLLFSLYEELASRPTFGFGNALNVKSQVSRDRRFSTVRSNSMAPYVSAISAPSAMHMARNVMMAKLGRTYSILSFKPNFEQFDVTTLMECLAIKFVIPSHLLSYESKRHIDNYLYEFFFRALINKRAANINAILMHPDDDVNVLMQHAASTANDYEFLFTWADSGIVNAVDLPNWDYGATRSVRYYKHFGIPTEHNIRHFDQGDRLRTMTIALSNARSGHPSIPNNLAEDILSIISNWSATIPKHALAAWYMDYSMEVLGASTFANTEIPDYDQHLERYYDYTLDIESGWTASYVHLLETPSYEDRNSMFSTLVGGWSIDEDFSKYVAARNFFDDHYVQNSLMLDEVDSHYYGISFTNSNSPIFKAFTAFYQDDITLIRGMQVPGLFGAHPDFVMDDFYGDAINIALAYFNAFPERYGVANGLYFGSINVEQDLHRIFSYTTSVDAPDVVVSEEVLVDKLTDNTVVLSDVVREFEKMGLVKFDIQIPFVESIVDFVPPESVPIGFDVGNNLITYSPVQKHKVLVDQLRNVDLRQNAFERDTRFDVGESQYKEVGIEVLSDLAVGITARNVPYNILSFADFKFTAIGSGMTLFSLT
jgi:hypothetical protein